MILSKKNAVALLLDINQDIEEYANAAVTNIIEHRKYDGLNYPPNAGFTADEKTQLDKLDNNEHLKNALRKLLADNTAMVIFNMLNALDGTGAPKLKYEEWTGVQLVDEETDDSAEPFDDTLHDAFFETYWEWKKMRGNKSWKLDTHEEK